ncbi:hypothetical protein ACFC06_13245 [Nocardia sp. NPDC056064]|uniref:hypothetical protein n=1 Tax=Nocardia sp. NPDC056064 TaxID=3345701 RepID=UPI0035DD95F8
MSGTEGTKIPPTTEWPPNWKHRDILTAFEQIATEPANGAATKYREAGAKWSQALEQFRRRMEVSIASAWEGDSAEASTAAIRRYTTDADELTPAFSAMGTQVTAAAAASVATKVALPGEFEPGFLDRMPWNKAVVRGEREDAENQARDVMGNSYVTPFAGTDGSIPVLPRPIHPLENQGDTAVELVGVTADNAGGTRSDTNPTSTKPATDDSDKSVDTSDEATEAPAEDTVSGDSSSTDPGSTDDDSTSPAGSGLTSDSPSITPAAATPTSPGGGVGPGAVGSGASGNPAGGGALGSGIPGPAIPGSPQAGASAAAASAGSSAGGSTAGTRGMSGLPGMMGSGAGRGKDDRSERSIPDYLITETHGEELVGDQGFVVEGGVLGSRYLSANPPRERSSDA